MNIITTIALDEDTDYYLIETKDEDLIEQLFKVAYYTYAIERAEDGTVTKIRATVKRSQLQLGAL